MKKNTFIIRIVLSALLVALLFGPTQAQGKKFILDGQDSRWMLSLVPLPLIKGGCRVDFDIRLKNGLWLQLAPQYNGLKNRLQGFAIQSNLRYYDPVYKGLYYSAGLMFDKNHVSDTLVFKKEGTEAYYDVHSWRIGGQLYIGYLLKIFPKTTIDVFGGFGFRYAVLKSADPHADIIPLSTKKMGLWSPLYDGLTFIIGLRIGLVL